jgi:hypothetical protein
LTPPARFDFSVELTHLAIFFIRREFIAKRRLLALWIRPRSNFAGPPIANSISRRSGDPEKIPPQSTANRRKIKQVTSYGSE